MYDHVFVSLTFSVFLTAILSHLHQPFTVLDPAVTTWTSEN